MSDFPSLDANQMAVAVLKNCAAFFQNGIKASAAGTYDEDGLLSQLTDASDSQKKLYRFCYRMGRYSQMSGWPEDKKQKWEHEVGRAAAYGMDDALAGRSEESVFLPYNTGWSEDDMSMLQTEYTMGYREGGELRGSSKTGLYVLGGLAVLSGIAAAVYFHSRATHPHLPLEREAYANPSKAPGMRVQSLLFSRDQWDVRSAKSWAREHGYEASDPDVRENTIRMRQADPKAFKRGTMRTIQFGEGSGIQAVVAKPKR